MEKKGFIVVNVRTQKAYVVTDVTQVAELIGKDRRTVWKWFVDGQLMRYQKDWMIFRGYQELKSQRGWASKNKAGDALTPVQEHGDF